MTTKEYWAEGENLTLRQQEDGSWKPAEPEPYHSDWVDKILCFFGYHSWQWNLPIVGNKLTYDPQGDIPEYATCVKCKTKHG